MHLSSSNPKQVSIADVNVVASSDGPVVVGEVHNLARVPVGGVEVTAALTTRTGSAIGTPQSAPTLLEVLAPGAKASFSIPFVGAHGTASTVSATVSADPQVAVNVVPLTVVAMQARTLGSAYEVTGTVKNTSQSPVSNANVVATFYGSSGKVVGAAQSSGAAPTLAPGASTTFTLTVLEQASLVKRYVLATEGTVVVAS